MQPENFPGKRSFVELELFEKHFIKNTRKKKPYRETLWSFFLLDTLIITFWIKNLILRTQSGPFFGHFFQFQKMGKGGLPTTPPTCASVAEYASISLNIPEYPWKCLSKLFWLCLIIIHVQQAFEDALGSKFGFWIWHGCIHKGLDRVLNMSKYGSFPSVIPEYTSICIIVPQYVWTWLNIAECPWICLKMPE